ncbi:hypothetical protein B0T17DRAFT_91850 [Bombardia bombarda]|uniref:Uncharacterized protein n=1 Tax=Bombardia bombarda TaxID=252184 RepID=A0AA40CFR4_9PEZI|nr:hypothetical protein B0T17DRAFT_91850 [Bombardia bombarda]
MAPKLLSALMLAHSVTATLNQAIHVNVIATIVAAADPTATNDPGYLACSAAASAVSWCQVHSSLQTTLPTATILDCLCCEAGQELDDIYSSCASYIYYSGSAGQEEAYTTAYELYQVCSAGDTCAYGGGGTGVLPSTTTRPTVSSFSQAATGTRSSSVPVTAIPPACSSLVSVYNECSESISGFATATASSIVYELASCACYDNSGTFNTQLDDWASSCAPWARTSATDDYALVSVFQSFCQVLGPVTDSSGSATSSRPLFTPTTRTTSTNTAEISSPSGASSSGGGLFGNGGGLTNMFSQQTTNPTQSAVTTTATSTSTNGAAAGGVPGGVVMWFANVATFVLGLFVLV